MNDGPASFRLRFEGGLRSGEHGAHNSPRTAPRPALAQQPALDPHGQPSHNSPRPDRKNL